MIAYSLLRYIYIIYIYCKQQQNYIIVYGMIFYYFPIYFYLCMCIQVDLCVCIQVDLCMCIQVDLCVFIQVGDSSILQDALYVILYSSI